MFGLPSLRIGRLFGIPLEVDASWLLVFLLVTTTLTFSYFPAALPNVTPSLYVVLGVITALAFFASLVLHELAHSLVARAGGLKISKVTLFLFGGVSQMEEEPRGPGHEFLLALAGPGTSVLLGVLSLAVRALLMSAGAPDAVWLPFEYLGLINIALSVFNLLPGFPLDGGRVLRAILWAITKDILQGDEMGEQGRAGHRHRADRSCRHRGVTRDVRPRLVRCDGMVPHEHVVHGVPATGAPRGAGRGAAEQDHVQPSRPRAKRRVVAGNGALVLSRRTAHAVPGSG
ncbi:hypothetical protein EG835_05625 [bacterium]|nr:hypothetical protein [bacterium]